MEQKTPYTRDIGSEALILAEKIELKLLRKKLEGDYGRKE